MGRTINPPPLPHETIVDPEVLKARLPLENRLAVAALMMLYHEQTSGEQAARTTAEQNGRGFTAFDAGIMTSFAEQYMLRQYLTDRQLEFLKPRIGKYVRQLAALGGVTPVAKDPAVPSGPPGAAVSTVNGVPQAATPAAAPPPTPTKAIRDEDHVRLFFPYDPARVERVRSLRGRRYVEQHALGKHWCVPLTIDNVEKIKEWGFPMDPPLQAWFTRITTPIPVRHLDWAAHPDLAGLYPFQKEGVEFIESRDGRALVGDEMGLGKTVQVLAYWKLHPEMRPAVVICPASLKLNWAREIKKWIPGTRVVIVNGRPPGGPHSGAKSMYALIGSGPAVSRTIVIINYDILTDWVGGIVWMAPKSICADEVHYIKNNGAKRTKAAKQVVAESPSFLALSGTAIVNRPIEIYNAVSMINPQVFPSYLDFAHRYCGAQHNGFGWDFNGSTNTLELHKKLKDTIMVRRLKKDVLPQLPPKIRSVVPMEITNAEEYERAEADFFGWLDQVDPDKVEAAQRAEALVKIATLKRLTIKGKIDGCCEWVDNFLEESERKLIVFTTHKQTVDVLMARYKDIKPAMIDGRVSQTARQEAVDRFQTDPACRLFIGNIKAAGVGLTLTAASDTCFFELPWTCGECDQAEDRVHRIGQVAQGVQAWYLIADNTIESEIAALLDSKRKVLGEVLDGIAADCNEDGMLMELLRVMKNRAA